MHGKAVPVGRARPRSRAKLVPEECHAWPESSKAAKKAPQAAATTMRTKRSESAGASWTPELPLRGSVPLLPLAWPLAPRKLGQALRIEMTRDACLRQPQRKGLREAVAAPVFPLADVRSVWEPCVAA